MTILIVSTRDDLHALSIRHRVRQRGLECQIIECDRLSEEYTLSWCSDGSPTIRLPGGDIVCPIDADLIWWRRIGANQLLDAEYSERHSVGLINNDCRGALEGILMTSFRGVWVSTPWSTDRASNKVAQLAAAKRIGFRIPRTVITQSADEVRALWKAMDGKVIVKPVVGVAGPLLFTRFLADPESIDVNSCRVCPAIYQEFIPGTRHIRLNCFGNQCFAATIETAEVDWRPNLNVPITPWRVPEDLHRRVRRVLDELDLAMGIVDLKMTPDGEIVWLEVNPQGQFLFLEGLAGMPLSDLFAEYLVAAAAHAPGGGKSPDRCEDLVSVQGVN